MKRIWTVMVVILLTAVAFAQDGRTIREITIRGNTVTNEALITGAMNLRPGNAVSDQEVQADEDAIYDLGFYSKVTIYQNNVGETQVDLLVDVAEYPVILEVRVEGNTVYTDEQILEIVSQYQELGAIWNNRNGPRIVRDVRELYAADGYFAEFEDLSPLADSPGTLNVRILEAKLGSIEIRGLGRTKQRTIERVIKSEPGEAFNIQKFRDDMAELIQRRWFEEVSPERVPGESPDIFNFVVNVKEARTAQINAGIAIDPQGRLVGTFSYGDNNFMGYGQNVGFQLNQATAGGGPSAVLAFTNPFYDAKDTVFTARLFSEVIYNFNRGLLGESSDDTDDLFNERRTGFAFIFNRPVSEFNTATLGLTARISETIDFRNTGNNNYIQQDGSLITLQMGYEYDTARPSIEPVRGESVGILIEPGYSDITKIGGSVSQFDNLLGSSTFLRTTLEFKKYWSKEPAINPDEEVDVTFKPRPVLAFRAKYGYIEGKVPFFEQLFVGGPNSLRGYQNQRFWGSQSFLSTLEYRYPVTDNFNVIGFTDYGGAWGGYGELPGFSQTNTPRFHIGYGLGVGFRTPLGPIRIDFAFNDEGGSRTHFTFGTSF